MHAYDDKLFIYDPVEILTEPSIKAKTLTSTKKSPVLDKNYQSNDSLFAYNKGVN